MLGLVFSVKHQLLRYPLGLQFGFTAIIAAAAATAEVIAISAAGAIKEIKTNIILNYKIIIK